MFLGKLGLRVFGSAILPYVDYFDALRASLKRAGMLVPLHEYLSVAALLSTIGFSITMVFGSIIVALAVSGAAYAYTLAVMLSLLVAGGIFLAAYVYPGILAKTIKNTIDRELPFSTFYMATVSAGGGNPLEVFKMLARRKGQIAEESKRIYTNSRGLGMNLTTAMQRVALRTPSALFADLLWGMISVITLGGNLEAYLTDKTRALMNNYRRSLDEYAKQIALYTEIYITLIIVGSLFFIILIAIISPLVGGNILFIQTFLVFFFMPLVSAAFIMLLKTISPN